MDLSKILDLATDNRNMFFVPSRYIDKKNLQKKMEKIELEKKEEIRLALTFDVEYSYGKAEEGAEEVPTFFSEIAKRLKKLEMKGTFFVQGNLVQECADELSKIKKEHEIGLHGYAHELWGEAWFVKSRPLDILRRHELIEKALKEFKQSGLERPYSFRAPYMVADKKTIEILNNFGFKVDSSAPAYRGCLPIINKRNGLAEIPVSVNPIQKIKLGFGVKSEYEVFNMKNLSKMSNDYLLGYVSKIIRIQKALGQKPYLVFLAHPWEFYENKHEKYCSQKNYEKLEETVMFLKQHFNLKTERISELVH